MVLAAVTQKGDALQYASEELQSDREVALAAIMQLLMKEYNTKHRPFLKVSTIPSIRDLISKQVLAPLDVIHVASACGLHWNHGMSELIEQDYSVLESKDATTGLLPVMTFACVSGEIHNDVDLNTLFEMVKKHPQVVCLQNVNKRLRNEMTSDIYDTVLSSSQN